MNCNGIDSEAIHSLKGRPLTPPDVPLGIGRFGRLTSCLCIQQDIDSYPRFFCLSVEMARCRNGLSEIYRQPFLCLHTHRL